ncbi:protein DETOXIFICATION 45, chloroplastic-like [Mangifera indica]|uniref:protein DETOXIFICATION 45, chloroplastic-like n=1 Tax=Mangifera indica TaxID=29780 RepID=UPI001CFAD93B|nr:protein DETOXIFICATION 45, chloroplastic-like [Mangifera indica]
MTVSQLMGGPSYGITGSSFERRAIKKLGKPFVGKGAAKAHQTFRFAGTNRGGFSFNNVIKCCGSISSQDTSDFIRISPSVGEFASNSGAELSKEKFESRVALANSQSPSQNVKMDLIMLSLPAIAGQAIEPLAQLMETAYIGKLGALELASAGISVSIFNILSKVFNIPLLNIATSFVAEDISKNAKESASDCSFTKAKDNDKKFLPSVSTALVLAFAIGVSEALAMYFGSGVFLNMMGISSASSMHVPAQQFLCLRAIGAPAVVVYLAIQGIFRGFKDTRTPVLCLGLGNFAAVLMFPILMNYCQLGATGAAISTVISQYIVAFLMIWYLNKRTVLLVPNMKILHFADYLKSGGFLLGRTLACVLTITLSTSMAARQGAIAMAAHQICLQVWLSMSLLADAQAASGQALIASYLAKGHYNTVKEITHFALKTGLFTGVCLALIFGTSFSYIATWFTNDSQVLGVIRSIILFLCACEPITCLAYIFDGLHYGVSDFSYIAFTTMVIAAISCAFLLYAPNVIGLSGVWIGLTLFMGLRVIAGYMRLYSKNGPWWFLQKDVASKLEVVI